MKKALLFFVSVFGFSFVSMADIVVKGTHIGNSVLFGTITVNCQNSENECVRIKASSMGGYDVDVQDMDRSSFHCDDYIIGDGSDGSTITFRNCTY